MNIYKTPEPLNPTLRCIRECMFVRKEKASLAAARPTTSVRPSKMELSPVERIMSIITATLTKQGIDYTNNDISTLTENFSSLIISNALQVQQLHYQSKPNNSISVAKEIGILFGYGKDTAYYRHSHGLLAEEDFSFLSKSEKKMLIINLEKQGIIKGEKHEIQHNKIKELNHVLKTFSNKKEIIKEIIKIAYSSKNIDIFGEILTGISISSQMTGVLTLYNAFKFGGTTLSLLTAFNILIKSGKLNSTIQTCLSSALKPLCRKPEKLAQFLTPTLATIIGSIAVPEMTSEGIRIKGLASQKRQSLTTQVDNSSIKLIDSKEKTCEEVIENIPCLYMDESEPEKSELKKKLINLEDEYSNLKLTIEKANSYHGVAWQKLNTEGCKSQALMATMPRDAYNIFSWEAPYLKTKVGTRLSNLTTCEILREISHTPTDDKNYNEDIIRAQIIKSFYNVPSEFRGETKTDIIRGQAREPRHIVGKQIGSNLIFDNKYFWSGSLYNRSHYPILSSAFVEGPNADGDYYANTVIRIQKSNTTSSSPVLDLRQKLGDREWGVRGMFEMLSIEGMEKKIIEYVKNATFFCNPTDL
ncbi:hypothetical protein DID76_04770, partial [Candidatus Marinamargulisbacteria bacterium SCGC AG-414-C22]